MCGRSRSSLIASAAPGHGTMRLHDVATPFSMDSKIAMFTASCMPRSSQLRISTRASGSKPSSSELIRDQLWWSATQPYCLIAVGLSASRSAGFGARNVPGPGAPYSCPSAAPGPGWIAPTTERSLVAVNPSHDGEDGGFTRRCS